MGPIHGTHPCEDGGWVILEREAAFLFSVLHCVRIGIGTTGRMGPDIDSGHEARWGNALTRSNALRRRWQITGAAEERPLAPLAPATTSALSTIEHLSSF